MMKLTKKHKFILKTLREGVLRSVSISAGMLLLVGITYAAGTQWAPGGPPQAAPNSGNVAPPVTYTSMVAGAPCKANAVGVISCDPAVAGPRILQKVTYGSGTSTPDEGLAIWNGLVNTAADNPSLWNLRYGDGDGTSWRAKCLMDAGVYQPRSVVTAPSIGEATAIGQWCASWVCNSQGYNDNISQASFCGTGSPTCGRGQWGITCVF